MLIQVPLPAAVTKISFGGTTPTRQNAKTTTSLPAPEQTVFGGPRLPTLDHPTPSRHQRIHHRRQPANEKTRTKTCNICCNTKPVALFPTTKLTDSCSEHPLPCLSCVASAIAADFTARIFSPTQIRCPVCCAALAYSAVLKYATREIREQYEQLTLVKALQDDQNFVLCKCGIGQIHETGAAQPIVTCLHCRGKSCFVHRMAWHENLTCAEYDALQKDPVGFRSSFERDHEAAWEAERGSRRAPKQQSGEGIDGRDQEGIASGRKVAQRARGLVREKNWWQKRKDICHILEAKKLRARQVNGRRGTDEAPRERDALAKLRAKAMKRREDEDASAATIDQTTKQCPGCKCRIEKNKGW
ncbi:hypothetical protein V8F06_014460 [Rhypophila decipiens]